MAARASRRSRGGRPLRQMSVLDRRELEQSPLADLHAIAAELGVEGFRRMRKDELIGAILRDQGGDDDGSAEAEALVEEAEDAESAAREPEPEAEEEPEPEPEEPEPEPE